ncbi:hypothetical protein BC939DRAFT_437881 [Gamsiella multidivaricata]|uniref:uncharacterized protein n=1 Tax=Gamsiella multidivaricata TaxID=101098 RepID=UPI0022203439|nr:uncharacterized protein BC939DRAFT_437881 [Gamsiella multidivaricata]KAI7831192.1 hypothetical protein BC939DRAFT_437881 [Gamsiella multidivaricata]
MSAPKLVTAADFSRLSSSLESFYKARHQSFAPTSSSLSRATTKVTTKTEVANSSEGPAQEESDLHPPSSPNLMDLSDAGQVMVQDHPTTKTSPAISATPTTQPAQDHGDNGLSTDVYETAAYAPPKDSQSTASDFPDKSSTEGSRPQDQFSSLSVHEGHKKSADVSQISLKRTFNTILDLSGSKWARAAVEVESPITLKPLMSIASQTLTPPVEIVNAYATKFDTGSNVNMPPRSESADRIESGPKTPETDDRTRMMRDKKDPMWNKSTLTDLQKQGLIKQGRALANLQVQKIPTWRGNALVGKVQPRKTHEKAPEWMQFEHVVERAPRRNMICYDREFLMRFKDHNTLPHGAEGAPTMVRERVEETKYRQASVAIKSDTEIPSVARPRVPTTNLHEQLSDQHKINPLSSLHVEHSPATRSGGIR